SEWRKGVASLQRLMTVYLHPQEEHLYRAGSTPQEKESGVVVSVKDITFRYPGTLRPILSNYDLELNYGERLGVVGPIGTGKSTLLAIMSGLERRLETGKVEFLGKN